jgi:fermentation-respiration switch protein FrsA (DUF1100 family)
MGRSTDASSAADWHADARSTKEAAMIQALGARYSPHDNPVERIWAALKAWLANSPMLTIQGRLRQVHAFFRQRSSAQLLATAAPDSSPWLPDRYRHCLREAA